MDIVKIKRVNERIGVSRELITPIENNSAIIQSE